MSRQLTKLIATGSDMLVLRSAECVCCLISADCQCYFARNTTSLLFKGTGWEGLVKDWGWVFSSIHYMYSSSSMSSKGQCAMT
jgi:hypothetical protein